MRSIQGGLQFGRGDQINQGLDDDFVDSLGDIDKGITEDSFIDTTPTVDTSTDDGGSYDPGDDSSSMGDSGDSQGGGDPDTGFGGDYGATYKGSLVTRKKPSNVKPKKMKRGGLASKK